MPKPMTNGLRNPISLEKNPPISTMLSKVLYTAMTATASRNRESHWAMPLKRFIRRLFS